MHEPRQENGWKNTRSTGSQLKYLPDSVTNIVTSIKLVGNKKVMDKKHMESYGRSEATTTCICKTAGIQVLNRILNNGFLVFKYVVC